MRIRTTSGLLGWGEAYGGCYATILSGRGDIITRDLAVASDLIPKSRGAAILTLVAAMTLDYPINSGFGPLRGRGRADESRDTGYLLE